ncbi:hypothetical protein CsSME_00029933 [Camellia sinensis var. sinensis]
MADAPEIEQLPMKEGVIPEGRYQIWRLEEEDTIGHGLIIRTINKIKVGIEASFLRCEDERDSRVVHHNLSCFNTESFLRSHFVIEWNKSFWVAVEKIDHSLHEYRNSHYPFFKLHVQENSASAIPDQEIQLSDIRLHLNYQNIIRDIIRGMCQLHQKEGTHGILSSKYIMIINHRAKFAFIRNKSSVQDDFTNLKTIFEEVLVERPNDQAIIENVLGGARLDDHKELEHFRLCADIKIPINLRKLYFHPLLMSSGERFLLPLRTYTRLRYRRLTVAVYAGRYNGNNFQWQGGVTQRNQQDPYRQFLVDGGYQDNPWGQFKFVRNIIAHINENRPQQTLLEAVVEKDLSSMFPEFLTRVYDFFYLHEITTSV